MFYFHYTTVAVYLVDCGCSTEIEQNDFYERKITNKSFTANIQDGHLRPADKEEIEKPACHES